MQNSQFSNPTVAKLLEVDAHLAAQKVELNAQLVSIQHKRHSLKSVIDMFSSGDTATSAPVVIPAQIPSADEQPQQTVPDVAVSELNSAITDTTAEAPVGQLLTNGEARRTQPPIAASKVKNLHPPRNQARIQMIGSST